jgi:hypothetical protein
MRKEKRVTKTKRKDNMKNAICIWNYEQPNQYKFMKLGGGK